MLRRTDAFSLLESLCMIVTLFVFGWLVMGVVRYELKNANDDRYAGVMFTTSEQPQAAVKTPEPKPDSKAEQAPAPAEKTSKAAGSEGSPTAKPQ